MTATAENISGHATEEQEIEITLLDSKGNNVGNVNVTIPSLEVGDITNVSAEILTVYDDIYDFEIK